MASLSDVSSRHDVVAVGAGPAGEAAAELGGSLGYTVALVERDMVGGTVVTSGGAPTADTLARLHPDVLRAMRLPSRAHRI
jgi:pyruvate/2-oxoglutarate dehydrogenase complex dihydrolipoamide dehydrogenase (E3) component